MQHIEQSNVAGESWNWPLNILTAKIDVPMASRRDATSLSDFPRIDVESDDRLRASAFTQIKREQTKPAANIQDRLVRATKQFVSQSCGNRAATRAQADSCSLTSPRRFSI